MIVHLKVALVPAVTPVTVVVGEVVLVMVAVPAITLQAPIPEVGALAAIVKVLVLQSVMSPPAKDAVGNELLVRITSSWLTAQTTPLVIVHLNVALVPTGTPVTPLVGLDGVVIVAVPVRTDQAPEPTNGVLPAKVKLATLH